MRRSGLVAAALLLTVLLAACGDDGESTADDGDTGDGGDAPADDGDTGDGGDSPAENSISIDGQSYAITVGECFGAIGVELEVLGSVSGSAESEAYAYVYSAEAGSTDLTLSAFRLNDAAGGLSWTNESGDGASDLTLEDDHISGEVPVTSADGTTATARFDLACPG